jgi:hypothetical protein
MFSFFKRKEKKTAREKLKENIQAGAKHMRKSAESFNDIITDKEQDEYSKTKAAAVVVLLDACLRLSLIEDLQPIVIASGVIAGMADQVDTLNKNQDQLKEQDDMIKDGKNLVTNIPKTIH